MDMRKPAVVGLILTSFAVVRAQQPAPASKETTQSAQAPATLAQDDRDFLTKAAADGVTARPQPQPPPAAK